MGVIHDDQGPDFRPDRIVGPDSEGADFFLSPSCFWLRNLVAVFVHALSFLVLALF